MKGCAAIARLLAACGLLIVSGGCFIQKKQTVHVPVAIPPAPAATTPERPPAPIAQIPLPTTPATPVPRPSLPATPPLKPSPFPPAPAPVRPAPVPIAPTPALGAILTADQRRKLDSAYRSDVRRASAVLNSLKGRALTPQQADTVSRASAFISEAEQYHDRDLTTAAELARRARVLTQDLAGARR